MINIIEKRFWLLALAGTMLIICIAALGFLGLKPAVEFRSGSMLTITFEQPVEENQLRQQLSDLGYNNALVQTTEKGTFLIRTEQLDTAQKAALENGLIQKFGALTESGFYSVSPIVASETVQNTAMAVGAAALGMFVYIAWAFRKMPSPFRFGTCAIVALLHDVFIVLGVFAILAHFFDWEVDMMFIIGVLTIIGYSINNVIIVFDRIRENSRRGISADFSVVVNSSMIQTITRNLNTSLTTIFAVLALAFFVGASIMNLAVVLLIGITAGIFSSVIVAPLLLAVWEGAGWGYKSTAMATAKTKS